mmetsp:Transcript_40824/g.104030  ORF Transcript_40824/g.104030 Transcript_40824/m.104030 type:complete len:241 (+) Transcript_40824:633-1355(+)
MPLGTRRCARFVANLGTIARLLRLLQQPRQRPSTSRQQGRFYTPPQSTVLLASATQAPARRLVLLILLAVGRCAGGVGPQRPGGRPGRNKNRCRLQGSRRRRTLCRPEAPGRRPLGDSGGGGGCGGRRTGCRSLAVHGGNAQQTDAGPRGTCFQLVRAQAVEEPGRVRVVVPPRPPVGHTREITVWPCADAGSRASNSAGLALPSAQAPRRGATAPPQLPGLLLGLPPHGKGRPQGRAGP